MVAPGVVNYPDLGEQVYDIIRGRILTVQLRPGSPLPVVDLTRQLGVSRTPVTDALNLLTAEGLVENVPRKGYFVARIAIRDYLEILDARLAIELAAVERGIAGLAAAQLEAMRHQNERMAQSVEGGSEMADYAEWMKRDSQFHRLLVESGGKPSPDRDLRALERPRPHRPDLLLLQRWAPPGRGDFDRARKHRASARCAGPARREEEHRRSYPTVDALLWRRDSRRARGERHLSGS